MNEIPIDLLLDMMKASSDEGTLEISEFKYELRIKGFFVVKDTHNKDKKVFDKDGNLLRVKKLAESGKWITTHEKGCKNTGDNKE